MASFNYSNSIGSKPSQAKPSFGLRSVPVGGSGFADLSLFCFYFIFFLIFFFVFKLCSSTSMNPIRQFGQFSAGFSRIQPDSAGFSGIPATKGRPCLAWTIQKPIEGFLKDSGDTFALFKLILTTSKEIGGSLKDL